MSLIPHTWALTADEARALQQRLASAVRIEPLTGPVRTLAGADLAYDKATDAFFAAVVMLDADSGEVLHIGRAEGPAPFPYIPGLLSFREVPALLAAFAELPALPDLIICDGQGRAHPRRLGLACHLGLWLDRPTIGCGKSRLLGTFEPLGEARGSTSDLMSEGERIGQVVRTRDGVKPLYVSPGHRMDQAGATAWILKLAQTYRQPEPIRMADHEAGEMRGGRE